MYGNKKSFKSIHKSPEDIKKNFNEIQKFVIDVASKVQDKQQFTNNNMNTNNLRLNPSLVTELPMTAARPEICWFSIGLSIHSRV